MAEKRPKQPTPKAISRWENEGGTTKNGKPPKRPRDLNQWAKRMVDIATGEAEEPTVKQSARKGGLKGGRARAKALSPEERSEIARAAAAARWKKS